MPKATPFSWQTYIEPTELRGGFSRIGEIHPAKVLDLSILSSDNETLAINKLYAQEEVLVVNFHQFDCVLFVETVLAIARGVALQDYSYSTFLDHLRQHRYWNGQIDGYCSRLHYIWMTIK